MKHLLIQFHTDTISPSDGNNLSKYYEAIWTQKHYMKPDAFWELPKWAGELSFNLVNAEIKHNFKVLKRPAIIDADIVFGSVLDVNKALFTELIELNSNVSFILGGYVDNSIFDKYDNVTWMNSIEEYCKSVNIKYAYGVNWNIFKGEKCIPRITMSYGCKHKCKFCTIQNNIVEVPVSDIYAQIMALEPLRFDLVYIDDKTFGQAKNHTMLAELGELIKEFNTNFVGFIVQTTSTMTNKVDWSRLPVYAAEIGVETYNDEILRELRKPSSINLITKAEQILSDNGINYIPNIVVGFLQENEQTYQRTVEYIAQTKMLHANLYNLAIYEEADMGVDVISENDLNELISDKSFNSDGKNELNRITVNKIASILLDKLNPRMDRSRLRNIGYAMR